MTKIYYKTFAQSELDRERDVVLSQRMTALNFVQPHHLDIPKHYQEDNASQLAIKELHKINNYKVCNAHNLNSRFEYRTGLVDCIWEVVCSAGTQGQAGLHSQLLSSHQQSAACCWQ